MKFNVAREVVMLFVCFVMTAGTSYAQHVSGEGERCAVLSVQAGDQPVRVYLDETPVGRTPADSVVLRPGAYLLRCLPLDSVEWTETSYAESLVVSGGEHIQRIIFLPPAHRIESRPFGAQILADGHPAGETPLSLRAMGNASIAFSLHGYRSGTAVVAGDTLLLLTPLSEIPNAPRSPYLSEEHFRNPVPIYVTAGAAILTGAAAAYFKLKADGEYADYRLNGTPGALEEVHRNDTRAGIALVLCQVNILGLAYLLFSR
jgi:hypothetical protein